jgi:MinD superfamily P-loop ATPase
MYSINEMKKLILMVGFALVLVPLKAYACSCSYSTPATAYNQAPLIFIGKMVSGTEKHQRPAQGGKTEVIESGQVAFSVTEIFKGSAAKTVTLRVDSMAGTSCGTYGLTRGLDYVVYAYASREGPDRFYTGLHQDRMGR